MSNVVQLLDGSCESKTNKKASLLSNPYGYGAKTIEQMLRYLSRSVSGVCFSSEEERRAAHLLQEMQDKIHTLERELKSVYHNSHKPDDDLDGQRLEYCLVHGIILADGCLHSDLDREEVLNGDYRAAIDRLMKD